MERDATPLRRTPDERSPICQHEPMAEPAVRRATWADLEALPANVTGELIRGVLYAMPRPRSWHQNAGSVLGAELNGPFQRGRGGPGGWWILDEPGIALPEFDVEEISPDVAGWKRERLPHPPRDGSITIAPDWVCEILSPTTRRHDLTVKRPLYAEAGIRWMWLVDVDARTVTASRNENRRWVELGVWGDDDAMRAEPFEAHEIPLADLWVEPAPQPR
jgi:Uma2 family endonuclease